MTLDPNPQEINCCQAMYHGILTHAKGREHWEDAKKYYQRALTGSHHSAKVFTSWIDENKSIQIPVQGGKVRDEAALRETIENAKKNGYRLDDAHQRGLMFASEFSVYLKPPVDHLWHSLRMLHDITEAGSTYAEVQKSVGRAGPLHNAQDANGVPVAGQLRERASPEEEGWLDLDVLEFSSGDFTVEGTPSGPLVPLLTQADLDVAAHLAFLEGAQPVAPSFSLDRAPSKRTDMRLDRKTFKPAWMAATPFGQSMFLADWIMKSFTMKDGLPSLTDPLISGGSVEGWQVPAIMQAVGNATGSYALPDGSHAENGRLEIVVRSTDVSRAIFKRILFKRVHQYRLNGADLFVESSLYSGGGDARDEEHHFRNDSSTGPGARAAVIMDNYQHVAEIFPVFERVWLILSVFSMMCQARRDGVELSSSTKRRISQRVIAYQTDYKRDYPKYELSPKPFHKGGCYCQGGVSGRTAATVSSDQRTPFVPQITTDVGASLSARRNKPGVASYSGGNPRESDRSGNWLRGGAAGKIPAEIAENLNGKSFENFGSFRQTFWSEVGKNEHLSSQFSPVNIQRMKSGRAPFVIQGQQLGKRAVYELDHVEPIGKGGNVYDINNIFVRSPLNHVRGK